MKKLVLVTAITFFLFTNSLLAQHKRVAASAGKAEYIEVEKGGKLPEPEEEDAIPSLSARPSRFPCFQR